LALAVLLLKIISRGLISSVPCRRFGIISSAYPFI
jgi:hypothetical protein